MGETAIELNANETTRPCSAALDRQTDASLLSQKRELLFDLVGASSSDQFVFCSSGAEAINQVLWSVFLEVSRKQGKCHFVTSAAEDAPTMQMMKRLEELGCYVKVARLNTRGEIDVAHLKELVNSRTALISVSMAQGLTGVIQPIEEISALAKEKGVLLHLDGSQAVGKYYFSFSDLGADYLTFSGDLIHSILGSGGLFAKNTAPLIPLILGGKGLRGGPLDTASLISLGSAAQQSLFFLDHMSLEVARLRDFFEKELSKRILGAEPLFRDSLRLPNTSCIFFPRVHQDALHYLLEKKIKTSLGGQYTQHLSSLLSSSGKLDSVSTLSFALSRMTTEQEIERAVGMIVEAVETLQSLSAGVFHGI